MLTAVILTRDEAEHIGRALASLEGLAERILVVDSGSTDATVEIARAAGAEVRVHPWRNYASQFNWALDQLPDGTDWVLRLDADEVVTPALAAEIAARLPDLDAAAVSVRRRMTFLGRPIRWGGVFPIRVVRLIRHGRGYCESRWMDEHLVGDGPVVSFRGDILDDNRKTIGWWTDKHNAYAAREAVDLLNLEFRFLPLPARPGGQAGVKRWIKERLYARLPGGFRALVYFLYRYVLRLGFLDGKAGAAFHLLQAFWYRYLVDVKLYEVRRHMSEHRVDAVTAIDRVLGIKL